MFSLEVGIKPLHESCRDEIKTHPFLLADIAAEEAEKSKTPEACELRKMAFRSLASYLMDLESELLQLRMALGRKRNKVRERQRTYRMRLRDDPDHTAAKLLDRLDEMSERDLEELERDPEAYRARIEAMSGEFGREFKAGLIALQEKIRNENAP